MTERCEMCGRFISNEWRNHLDEIAYTRHSGYKCNRCFHDVVKDAEKGDR